MLFNKKNGKKNKTEEKINFSVFKRKAAKKENDTASGVTEEATNQATAKVRVIKPYMRAIPLILVALAIFTAICFITGSEVGSFGSFFADFLLGLFSYMAYTIPFFMILHAIFYIKDVKSGKVLSRFIFTLIVLLTLAEIAYVIPNFNNEIVFDAAKFYEDGKSYMGGGFFGGLIGFALMSVLGKVGVIIFTLLVIVLYVVFFFGGKNSSLKRLGLKLLASFANYGAKVEKRALERKELKKKKSEEAKKPQISEKKANDLLDDEFFSANNGARTLEIPELGIYESKNPSMAEGYSNLRMSVDNDSSDYDSEPIPDATRTYGDFDESEGDFTRADFGDDSDTIVFEAKPKQEFKKNPYGLDDSADAIFTEEFDPYDLATNEKYAFKPSTRTQNAKQTQTHSAQASFKEDLREMTPQQIAREKMAQAFEQRKQEAIKRQAEAEAKRLEEEAKRQAEEQRQAEEERVAREEAEARALAINEEKRRISELERLTDYSDFENEQEGYRATLQRNERFRFVQDTENDPYQTASASIKQDKPGSAGYTEFTFSQKNEEVRISAPQNNSYTPNEFTSPRASFEFDSKQDESFTDVNTTFAQERPSSDSLTVALPTATNVEKTNEIKDYEPEIETVSYEEPNDDLDTLTVEREKLPPEPDYIEVRTGLDFSDADEEDEEDEDFSEDYAETEVEKQEIPEEEQNEDIKNYQKMFDIFNKQANESDGLEDEDFEDETEELDDEYEEDLSEDEDVPFDFDDEPAPVQKKPPQPENKPKPLPDYSKYKFPPLDLLKPGVVEDNEQINDEIQQSAEKLINTLESFAIKATVRGIERGPRITRYSIVPAKGIRVNQIEKLSDDLAMALAAESIRIEAPIPGKSAVGIEVPNQKSSIVSLRELIESENFTESNSKTTVCIGKSVEGTSVFGDLADMPHLLIAGATGMGKSVCMNSLIMSILYKARPDEVKFIMIDPKKVEFAPYNGIPHLLVPVVTEPKQAAGALCWAVDEMNKRYEIIEKLSVRGIDSYNEKVKEDPSKGAPMPKIIIFIDELNDLMIQVRDPVENLIMLIAQKARAAGIHLVIGTQRPSVNVITGVIKANIPSRIACKVSSGVDSRTIIEQIGAEKLIGKGDMLFAPGGKPNPKRVQGAFVSEKETESIVEFVKKQFKGDLYDEQAMEDMKRATQRCDKSKNGDSDDDDDDCEAGFGYLHDRKFLQAVELAIRNGSVATSFLQRKLHIGYGKAAQYIDIMEDLGIVGEKNGSKAREILISMQEWNEKLSRLTDE